MLYAYGFLLAPGSPEFLGNPQDFHWPLGMDNADVQGWGPQGLITDFAQATDRVVAIVQPSPFPQGALPQEDTALLSYVVDHDRVLQVLFQQTPVLPLRFGTHFPDALALMDHLQQHQDQYHSHLVSLRNQAEFTLTCQPVTVVAPSPPQAKGRDFFLAKKQRLQDESDRHDRQVNQLQALRRQLDILYPQSLWPETLSIATALKVYLLASFKRQRHLEQQLLDWQKACPDWELGLTGPWLPYHFLGNG